MRIAIGQLWQETNTFNPLPTTRRDFEDFGVLRGDDLVRQMADTNELGGFIQSLLTWRERPEIVGLVRLPAWPSGPATAETFDWLRDELRQALARQPPVDAVLLALHGAMVAVGHPDVEGEILAAVRQVIGPHVPLVATLDLHAHVTETMVRTADALVLYHTAPHIDVVETGQRATKLLRRILVDGARPMTAWQRIPAVAPAERANTQDPASVSYALREMLVELESRPKVLAAGLATVQPWLDVPQLASAAVVVTDGDAELARGLCAQVADAFWQKRRDYLPDLTPLVDAVRIAHEESRRGLVVLSDGADATTSGAPGDGTAILGELLKYDWTRPALVALVSPEAVAAAERAGEGAALQLTLGGVRDTRHSQPIEVSVHVERVFDARFVLSGHLGCNLKIDMGRSAVLRHGNVRIVATSRSGPHFSPELFRAGGLDPFAASVLVAKSPCGFRAAYADHAAKILLVQSPGCAPLDFWNYPYAQIDRPLWPWDDM